MQFGPCSHETLRRDRNVYYIWGWQYYVLVSSSYNLRKIEHLSYQYLYLNAVSLTTYSLTSHQTELHSSVLYLRHEAQLPFSLNDGLA